MEFEIEPFSPLNFHLTLKATPPAYPFIYENRVLRRIVRLSTGKLVPIKVKALGNIEKPILHVIALSQVKNKEIDEIVNMLNWFLSLDEDLSEVYALMESDPFLSKIKDKFYGVKPWTVLTPFEGIVNAIIFQQVSLWAAFSMVKELVLKLGEKIQLNQTFYDFPSPETISRKEVSELKACKLSRNKASYIKGIAEAILKGELNFNELRKVPVEEALQTLMKIKGIGRWTAEIFLVTGLKRWEVIPADDLGIRRAMGKFYLKKHMPKREEVRKFAERWGNYKWPIAYYLLVASERLERLG